MTDNPRMMTDNHDTAVSHVWQTIEQAAMTLKISSRTLARRISSGQVESRSDANGRRLVLVQVANDTPADMADDRQPENDSQMADEKQGGGAGSDAPADTADRISAGQLMIRTMQDSIGRAQDEAFRARRSSRLAWSVVMVLMTAAVIASWVGATMTTTAKVRAESLQEDLTLTRRQLDQTRQDLLDTRVSQAQAQVKLNTMMAQTAVAAGPTTRPSSLLDRIASLFE